LTEARREVGESDPVEGIARDHPEDPARDAGEVRRRGTRGNGCELAIIDGCRRQHARRVHVTDDRGNLLIAHEFLRDLRGLRAVAGVVPSSEVMSVVGLVALAANAWCLILLSRHRGDDINMRSAWLCSRNDVIANASVLVAAGGVALSGSGWPDILVGLAIAVLFGNSAIGVIGDARQLRAQHPQPGHVGGVVRVVVATVQEAVADADQLEQVVINLIRNAVDASIETGGGVTVTWDSCPTHADLRIEDEGPGLSNTSNLFVPFFTTKPSGSGIGLALSRQIADTPRGDDFAVQTATGASIRPLIAAELRSAGEQDVHVFGGHRFRVLEWMLDGAPQYAWVAHDSSGQPQYCLGRAGRLFDQIGPVVARDAEVAKALVGAALRHAAAKPVVIDAFDAHEAFAASLRRAGFRVQRPLYRMCRPSAGASADPHVPSDLIEFAILGPEFA